MLTIKIDEITKQLQLEVRPLVREWKLLFKLKTAAFKKEMNLSEIFPAPLKFINK